MASGSGEYYLDYVRVHGEAHDTWPPSKDWPPPSDSLPRIPIQEPEPDDDPGL